MTACLPVDQQQNPEPTIASLLSSSAYPLSTPYSGANQPPKTVTPIDRIQQETPTLSSSPSTLSDVPTSQNYRVSQLQMFDTNTGWAVYAAPFVLPESSKILRSTNGVQTWMDVTPPITDNSSNIRAAYFIDADNAVVVSTRSHLPDSPAVEVISWRTTNGGETWQTGEIFTIDQTAMFYPVHLSFLDSEQGWMLGASDSGMNNMRVHIFETVDGGKHWNLVYDSVDHLSDPETLWIKGYYPYKTHLAALPRRTVYFSDGRLFDSRDGGASWLSRLLEPPDNHPDINCTGVNCKYLDSVSAPQFTSSLDGFLIRRVYLNSSTTMDVLVYYPNTQSRLPLPKAQYFYFTTDGGQTWEPKSSPVKMGTVYFLNTKTGWALGKNDPDPTTATQLYQTTDGGETWSVTTLDCLLPLGSELQFIDEQNGFAFNPIAVSDYYKDFDTRVRQSPNLFSTRDGGRSWEKVTLQVGP